MRYITLTIFVSLITSALFVEAKPRRNIVERERSSSSQLERGRSRRRVRRRVIEATPSTHRSLERRVVSSPQRRNRLQRDASARAARQARRSKRSERRQARKMRQVERRKSRKNRRIERRRSHRTERHSRRFEQRRAQRRQRGRSRSIVAHNGHSRYVPTYVSTPTRVVVTYADRPQHNHDQFFDHLYHDGQRYGVNGDLRDEEHRINHGIRKGLLTPTEADNLIDLLIDAYDLETECVADGYLTPEEEGDLYWAERALNRAIRWEMRDFDVW